MNTDTPLPEDYEDFGNGIARYWLFDRKVVVFVMRGESRPTIEKWYSVTRDTLRGWATGQRSITIHDFTESSLTNYARGRAKDLAEELHDVNGHTIMVVKRSLVGHLIQIFVNTGLAGSQPGIERHVVTSMDEALKMAERLAADISLSETR